MKFSHMIFFILCSSLYGEKSLTSIYIGDIYPKDKDSVNYSLKIRNQLITFIVRNEKKNYNILDDELVRQLALKMAKLQRQGCDETTCQKALDEAINWDQKITGDLQKDGDFLLLSIKNYEMNKETFQPKVKISLYEKIHIKEIEKHIEEIAKAIVNEKYLISLNHKPFLAKISLPSFNKEEKTLLGNIFLPGYSRLEKQDSSGYFLSSFWIFSLSGIAYNYPAYTDAKNKNNIWLNYTSLFAFSNLGINESLGFYYSIDQTNNYYNQAYQKTQIINGLSVLSLMIWSYNFIYSDDKKIGKYNIEDSDWNINLKISKNVFSDKDENQYQLNFSRSF